VYESLNVEERELVGGQGPARDFEAGDNKPNQVIVQIGLETFTFCAKHDRLYIESSVRARSLF